MATIQGFIFDLDGVLVDTARYHFQAWQRLAKQLGIHFTEKENEQLKGISRKESLQKILEWGNQTASDAEMELWMRQKNDWYLELINNMDSDEVLPGVAGFLENARNSGLKIALGSASRNARAILQKVQLEHYFHAIIDGNKAPKLTIPYETMVKADAKVPEVMMASICAKVIRDRLMHKYHRIYTGYGFDGHKGYGTKQHYHALFDFGPCPIHRTSFNLTKQLTLF